jgi:hypothetical protein
VVVPGLPFVLQIEISAPREGCPAKGKDHSDTLRRTEATVMGELQACLFKNGEKAPIMHYFLNSLHFQSKTVDGSEQTFYLT